jgi:hypothetical protein
MPKRMLKGEIILQKQEGTTTYKMVGQCGDEGQRLARKRKGQSRLQEICEGSQSPPRAVVSMMMMI